VPRRIALALIFAVLALVGPDDAGAQGSGPWLRDLSFPTNMAFAADGRLFFTEKSTGQVRVVTRAGALLDEPFVTVPVLDASETGLLGVALHPRFDEGQPWVYLYRSDPASGMNEVLRIRAEGDRAVGQPELLLATVPATNVYHNGGDMTFGPDGHLYVTVGEAHQAERAQDPSDPGGKVLRLTPEGEPASGNPFGDDLGAFTIGHRNSFGICVDPATGDLWETENGPPKEHDEVNRIVAGGNYGWPELTGDSGGRYEDPVASFDRTVVPTGCAWWRGELYVGEYANERVVSVDPSSGEVSEAFPLDAGVTDLQVGPDGSLYVATTDAIWRLTSPSASTGGRGAYGIIAVLAAVVMGGALVVRAWAGRGARS